MGAVKQQQSNRASRASQCDELRVIIHAAERMPASKFSEQLSPRRKRISMRCTSLSVALMPRFSSRTAPR